MEEKSREGKRNSWMEELERGVHCSGQENWLMREC